jgi:hypothetical protein
VGDDTLYVFIIVAGLTALIMPGIGDLIIGLFALGIVTLGFIFPDYSKQCRQTPPSQHHATGR